MPPAHNATIITASVARREFLIDVASESGRDVTPI